MQPVQGKQPILPGKSLNTGHALTTPNNAKLPSNPNLMQSSVQPSVDTKWTRLCRAVGIIKNTISLPISALYGIAYLTGSLAASVPIILFNGVFGLLTAIISPTEGWEIAKSGFDASKDQIVESLRFFQNIREDYDVLRNELRSS